MHQASTSPASPSARARRPDRFRRLERDSYDVIVIGAGLGGLTAAALLARRGRSVLVIDQHYVAGGNATVFHRPGYEFDIGLHYIGQCAADGVVPRMLAAAGAQDVAFTPLDPDGFDTLIFPDFEFRVSQGLERYRARLVEQFPAERRGIDRYTRALDQMRRLLAAATNPRKALRALPRSLLALRYADGTLGHFLDSCTRDPALRAVLAAEGGDYAVPPSRASFALHAALMVHYLEQGAFYPVGGGQRIADALAASIEAAGGKLLLRARAERILVQGGRVLGVELSNKHVGRRLVRAPVVISNADIKRTLLELVEPGALKRRTTEKARRWEMAPALGVLYLGVRREAFRGRERNTNYWLYGSYDLESAYSDARAGRFSSEPFEFISIASFKDPTNKRLAPEGIVNLELMTLAPSEPEAWGVTAGELESGRYSHAPAYLAQKRELSGRLLAHAERVLPGLGEHVAYQELSTPLTHQRYTLSTGGTSYGIAALPEQFLHRRPAPRTEIEGLVLAGASLRTGHGIVGSMTSGVMAAAEVAGRALVREALGSPRRGEERRAAPALTAPA